MVRCRLHFRAARWRPAAMLLALASASAGAQPRPPGEPILLVQSLPITGPLANFSRQVIGGARSHVEAVNAQGGVHGRRLELLTLDDGGDPAQLEANLRRVAKESRPAAFLHCAGDAACQRAAQVAAEVGVPLIGPMSGLKSLRQAPRGAPLRWVVPLRAGYDREAAALAQQLRGMGISRVAALTDAGADAARASERSSERPPERAANRPAEHLAELQAALAAQGVAFVPVPVSPRDRAGLNTALQRAAVPNPQALLIDLSPALLDELAGLPPEALARMPRVLLSLATPAVTSLTALFREQVIGFTTVVPNPEMHGLPLVREFDQQASRHGSGTGMFEALEAYVSVRVTVQALRQAGPRADAAGVAQAVWQLGTQDLGGFVLHLDRTRASGADWVEPALRSRRGQVLK